LAIQLSQRGSLSRHTVWTISLSARYRYFEKSFKLSILVCTPQSLSSSCDLECLKVQSFWGGEDEKALTLLGASSAGLRENLNALDGSLLIQVQQGGRFWWRFKHPTIRDAFGSVVAEDRELMDIDLTGTPVPRLLVEISCGDVEWEGVKVKVPGDRFDFVISRIEKFSGTDREARDSIHSFLATRCGADFLKRFMERPAFLGDLSVSSYFYAVSDVRVINRLHKLGLLPEPERQRHLADVRHLAAFTPDAGFLSDTVSFLSPAEVAEITRHVRTTLLPHLEATIDSWRDNWSSEEDPEGHFDHLKTALNDYERAFADDEEALAYIEAGIATIESTIEELRSERSEPPDRGNYYRGQSGASTPESSRSTFDDVDV
jgi:hypothetical protein